MLKEKIKTVNDDGQLIEGYRVITTERGKLRQVIYFKGKKELDSGDYKANEKDTVMLRWAALILWQISLGRHF